MGDEIVVCPVCHKQMLGNKCTCDYQAPPKKSDYSPHQISLNTRNSAIGMKPRKITKRGSEQAKELLKLARKIALTKNVGGKEGLSFGFGIDTPLIKKKP